MPIFEVPAFCKRCGFVPSGFFVETGSSGIMAYNFTTCVKCGGQAELMGGSLNAAEDALEILLHPDENAAALAALREIAAQYAEGKTTLAEAQERAAQVSPKFAYIFSPQNWSPEVKSALIAALGTALFNLIAARLAPPEAPTIVVQPQVIVRTMEPLKNSTSLPYIPVPTPRPKR